MHIGDEHSYRTELFERRVKKGEPGECWQWLGAKTSRGAGTFGLGALGGVRSAHVAAWVLYRDPDYDADQPYTFTHLCGRNGCVNPDHIAILGPYGLANPKDVVLYVAQRHPAARAGLLSAAELLPSFEDG